MNVKSLINVLLQTGNKKEAEKVVKNIIKIVIKLAVLYRHNQLTKEDLILAERFKNKFNAAALAIISFHEVGFFPGNTVIHRLRYFQVEFSYDRLYLAKLLAECQSALAAIVQRHLTEKSMQRVEHVFTTFTDPGFLDAIFRPKSEHKELVAQIVRDMNKALDSGELQMVYTFFLSTRMLNFHSKSMDLGDWFATTEIQQVML